MNETATVARTANLLTVFAAMIGDALSSGAVATDGRGASETAALITIASYPGQSVKTLAAILGLSHSATVRLIETLRREGLVTSDRGQDRRHVAIAATAAGQEATAALLVRRRARLVAMLAALDRAETRQLAALMAKMIAAETRSVEAGDRLCRFCDLANCPQESCPVEQEACRLRAPASS